MELIAPSDWRRVDFISDLHLLQEDGATYQAFEQYLASTSCDALFILGDLFEVWIGDDALTLADSFDAQCAAALRSAARRMPLFIMHGNRDFLMGEALMAACGAKLLDDPTLLAWAGQRWLLSHGDALCLDDKPYMEFRAQVRSAQWQQDFLALPLDKRSAIARELRGQSEARKREVAHYADLDTKAVIALLDAHDADLMVHGHTHKPAVHTLDEAHTRYVLSDWDANSEPPRLEVMRWTWSGQAGDTPRCARIASSAA